MALPETVTHYTSEKLCDERHSNIEEWITTHEKIHREYLKELRASRRGYFVVAFGFILQMTLSIGLYILGKG